MVAKESTMLELGTAAPPFQLPDPVTGQTVSYDRHCEGAKASLIMFICNHCPYVIHIAPHLAKLASELMPKGLSVIAISANDATKYPADRPEAMKEEHAARGYPFPYLYDETQEVAKAYRAACTPDFYLFDAGRTLVYRGQFDNSRPGNGKPVTGNDLRQAIEQTLQGLAIDHAQKPSIGCNIKWKPGNEPDYF